MELGSLNGDIIGVISNDYHKDNYQDKKVSEIITRKPLDALRMVQLDASTLDKLFSDLSLREQNKVILASKLQDKVIILIDFSKGLLKKDLDYFKSLFKKVVMYGRKIILVDKNAELFLNVVNNVYVIDGNNIILETNNLFSKELGIYIDLPKLVKFTLDCEELGIKINHYQELDELLKAIYRIKS